jgi:DNA sulfur modification protein DndE
VSLKQIRLSAQAKDQLIRLKTRTGIGQWIILCRWAFCLSLRQPAPPTPVEVPADSNVEMSWQVFGGEAQELYLAVLKERCAREGFIGGITTLPQQATTDPPSPKPSFTRTSPRRSDRARGRNRAHCG